MAYKIPFFMNFIGPQIFADSGATAYHSTRVYVDPADFDGTIDEAVIDAVAEVNLDDPTTLKLYHTVDGLLGSVTWAEPVDLSNQRKSFTFNPSSVAGYYYLQVEGDGLGAINWCIGTIVRNDPTMFWVNYPLITGYASTGGSLSGPENDQFAYAITTDDTSYRSSSEQGSVAPFNIILKDEAKFSTIDKWRLSGVGWTTWINLPADADVLDFRLVNKTTATAVTGAALNWTETVPTYKYVDVANNAANFTDLQEFRGEFKSTNGKGVFMSRAELSVHVINYTPGVGKAEIPIPVANAHGTSDLLGIACRQRIDPDWFPTGTLYTFESTGFSPSGTATIILQKSPADVGNVNSIGTPATLDIISGSWVDEESIVTEQASVGYGLSTTNNEVLELEMSDFTFSQVIADPIQQVSIIVQGGPYNQSAAFATKINSSAYVSGTEPPVTRTGPPFVYVYHGLNRNHGSGWTAAEFATPTVRLRWTQPNNPTETEYHLRTWTGCIYILSGTPLATLTYTGDTNPIRERSAAVLLDANSDRYFVASTNTERGQSYLLAETTAPEDEGGGEPPEDGVNFKLFSITIAGFREGRS